MDIINYLKHTNGSEAILEHVGFHESGDYLIRGLFSTDTPWRKHKFETEKELIVISKDEVDKIERQECGSTNSKSDGPHYWRVHKNGDRTCSHCGSLHPDSVLDKIRKYGFGVIGLSDKQYKWYVGINSPIRIPDYQDGGFKYYRYHDTEEFIDTYSKLLEAKVNETKDN